jgi:hypothetical protein
MFGRITSQMLNTAANFCGRGGGGSTRNGCLSAKAFIEVCNDLEGNANIKQFICLIN